MCHYQLMKVEEWYGHYINLSAKICQYFWHFLSQPHFEESVRMRLTFPKWGLGSLLGLPKFQNSIAGVKTPCIVTFFISLENYENVDVENGLA